MLQSGEGFEFQKQSAGRSSFSIEGQRNAHDELFGDLIGLEVYLPLVQTAKQGESKHEHVTQCKKSPPALFPSHRSRRAILKAAAASLGARHHVCDRSLASR